MVRTQIQLTEDQLRQLKVMALEAGTSVAELVRQSIEQFLSQSSRLSMDEKRQRSLAVLGKYTSGEPDVGVNHDQYLAEFYGDFLR